MENQFEFRNGNIISKPKWFSFELIKLIIGMIIGSILIKDLTSSVLKMRVLGALIGLDFTKNIISRNNRSILSPLISCCVMFTGAVLVENLTNTEIGTRLFGALIGLKFTKKIFNFQD
jgi:uncharacterized membrane protein AbrB (regulator of aidB expression)